MKLTTLVALIFCNLVWSANPAMCKIIFAAGAAPALTAWLRYASALVAYVLAMGAVRVVRIWQRRSSAQVFLRPDRLADAGWLLLIGGMGFSAGPLLQMTGLQASRATDNALIVAMEPLVTVLMAWVILREAISLFHLVAFAVALSGFALLTGITPAQFFLEPGAGKGQATHFFGNCLILTALLGEACYSVAGRKLLMRHAATGIFGSALLVGVTILTLVLLGSSENILGPLAGFGPTAWAAVIFIGPLGTALTYLFWMIALSEAPVASVALTLFIQPVFGSFWGYTFLEERLSYGQWMGAFLISLAVVVQSIGQTIGASSAPGGAASGQK